MQNNENLYGELQNLLRAHHEWLLIDAAGKSFAFRETEIDLDYERGRTLLGFLDDKGFQTWRVAAFKTKNDEILLDLVRSFETARARIRLVPRARAKALGESVEAARLEKAQRLAALIAGQVPHAKIVRVELNKDNGRFAQIMFEDSRKKQTAVLGDVSESLTPEILLSAAIFRLAKLQRRRKNPVEAIWLAAEKSAAKKLRNLHALLRENWKSKIFVKEISRDVVNAADTQGAAVMKDLPALDIADLWRATKPRDIKPAAEKSLEMSEAACGIIGLAPEEIDVVRSRHGETLRFNGLAFARVRRVLGREKVWFGTGKTRQILAENNSGEFSELIENLQKFRRAAAPNRRHAFYKDAPEAWLEAVLRRNIRLLDANLILAPLYHQFRAERERIDLLALRRDKRLVIIEVKTAPDREMIFQVAGYWRRIERQRRCGNLQKARLFGALEIAAAPAICYVVAPTLSFHRDFRFLAATIAPEIEIHRFNLAENWRARLKVLNRESGVKD